MVSWNTYGPSWWKIGIITVLGGELNNYGHCWCSDLGWTDLWSTEWLIGHAPVRLLLPHRAGNDLLLAFPWIYGRGNQLLRLRRIALVWTGSGPLLVTWCVYIYIYFVDVLLRDWLVPTEPRSSSVRRGACSTPTRTPPHPPGSAR